MIIKLPIIEDNKIIFCFFNLNKHDNYLILSLLENKTEDFPNLEKENLEKQIIIIKVMCFNNTKGIIYFTLYLPFQMIVFDKYIWTNSFLNIAIISDFNYKFDFFCELNKIINKKYNISFINLKNITDLSTDIWKISNNEYNTYSQIKNFLHFDNYLKYLWEFTNLITNMAVYLIFIIPNFTNKNIKEYQLKNNIIKKIILIANNYKTIKFKIFSSNDYFILDHLQFSNNSNIKNINELEINNKYFIKINNLKYILVNIDKINNNLISINDIEIEFNKYEWYHYVPHIKISLQYIYIILFGKIEIYSRALYKIDSTIDINYHDKIIKYFLYQPIISNLYYLLDRYSKNKEDVYIQILKSNSYDNNFFNYVVNKYNELPQILLIIKILFSNYNFPIKFNKYELDTIFDNILFISLYNYKNLIFSSKNNNETKYYLINDLNNIIPSKVKLFYFNILKIFYQLINLSEENIYNLKFFHDNLYKNFIKIFFFENSNTINLLKQLIDKNTMNIIKNNIQNNFILIDIINKLNWKNLRNKINYLHILINNKTVLYNDKLSKIFFTDNYDNRIKSIILNPYIMFNYLTYENEFIEWISFIDYKISELFYNHISLSTNDIKDLGKLIYCLYNVDEQDFKDNYYKLLVHNASQNTKIILYNQRINIKIKEFFSVKINLHFGTLVKHINNNTNLICYDPKNEIIMLKTQLKIMTTKYLKYKRKYNDIKTNIYKTDEVINNLIPL